MKWEKVIKQVRNHRDKLMTMTYFEELAFPDELKTSDEVAEQTKLLDLGKQAALYADIIDSRPCAPHELWVEPVASNALKWAEGRVQLAVSIDAHTPLLKSVDRQGLETMLEQYPELKQILVP